MKISARNQLKGVISKLTEGAVNAYIVLDVAGQKVSSTISMAAVRDLGLSEGMAAIAVIKATDVMIALGEPVISARTKLKGTVAELQEGAVNGIVKLSLADGNTISATISMAAIADLGLKVGMEAVAVIKATSVMIAVA